MKYKWYRFVLWFKPQTTTLFGGRLDDYNPTEQE